MARTSPGVRPPAAGAPELSDPEVVRRVAAGEVALFEILVRRYNQRLFRVARGIVADDGEAEDVVQEAYLQAFHHLDTFRGEASFATWLTRITVHAAMARARKGRRLVLVDGEAVPMPESHDRDPESLAGNGELRAALGLAVDELPAALRTVFVLREVEGLSTEEAAAALELTTENVRVRLHRARARLRQRLDERLGREARRLYLFDGARCDRMVRAVMARLPAR
ncbi:MAG TPA: RNA polymerase sigma factor [Thermoanaerobaculia bacterium]|nr:RNA polymerase sigma factor [Thermoanaerobaculia bacterium]